MNILKYSLEDTSDKIIGINTTVRIAKKHMNVPVLRRAIKHYEDDLQGFRFIESSENTIVYWTLLDKNDTEVLLDRAHLKYIDLCDNLLNSGSDIVPVDLGIKHMINVYGLTKILEVFHEMLKNKEYDYKGADEIK